MLQTDDSGCSAVEETREGKSIYRKSSQGPNIIVLATDGEILSYLSGIEMETNEQIGENLGVVLTMDPNERITSLKSMFEKHPLASSSYALPQRTKSPQKPRVCAHQNLSSSFSRP